MTFKLASKATYWWPITAKIPAEDRPGEFDEVKFEVQYAFLGNEEQRALVDELAEKRIPDRELAARIVTNFRHIEDENGGELAFSLEALARVCNVSGIDEAIAGEYFASRSQAASKN